MKRLFLVPFMLLSSSSFASFELAILTDAATGFHRFDAETGIYLGAFGVGRSSSTNATWANQSTGKFYAMNSSGIRSFDYSTGEYLGIVNGGASSGYATNDSNGDFITVNGSNVITNYSLNGTDTNFTLTAGIAARWITKNTDGKWYVGDSNNGGRILRSSTGSLSSSFSVIAAGLGIAGVAATNRNAVACPSPFLSNYENLIITHDATISYFYGINSGFNFTGNGSYGLPTTTRNGIANAHSGQFHLGTITAGVSQMRSFDDAGLQAVTWTTSMVPNPRALTIVLAPEPGTMLAIGAGLAFLAKRRKSK